MVVPFSVVTPSTTPRVLEFEMVSETAVFEAVALWFNVTEVGLFTAMMNEFAATGLATAVLRPCGPRSVAALKCPVADVTVALPRVVTPSARCHAAPLCHTACGKSSTVSLDDEPVLVNVQFTLSWL